jgi:hypothetical protein
MKRILLLALFVLIILAGCAADPRNEADAYATRSRADQAALNSAQQRYITEDQHTLAMQQAAATQAERTAALQRFFHWFGIVGTLVLCITFVAGGASASWAFWKSTRALSAYAQRRAEVSANLISLDPVTRQYPLLIQYIGKGRYSLVNPNNGMVLLLDSRHAPDRQLIASAGMVQATGVMAREARKSTDPAGMALIRPTVIDAQEGGVKVGADLWENLVEATKSRN